MKIVAQLQLRPTPEHARSLLALIEESNRVANMVSEFVFATRTFGRRATQKAIYATIRHASHLSSQHALHAIRKVADAYRRDKSAEHRFRPHGAITLDARILTIHADRHTVSMRTLECREAMRFSAGEHQHNLLRFPTGESDLLYRNGKFFLLVSCDVAEEHLGDVGGVLGVDLGIVNIAADSDGRIYSGAHRDERRAYYQQRRSQLQHHGTRSAKRRLKELSGRQRNFQRNENHIIAKQIVAAAAEGTKRVIALEDLSGIRARTTVRRQQRSRHSNWSFAQLRGFISYKAAMRGLPIVVVDPENTSRECPECGHTDRRNRVSQATFRCRGCGHQKHADIVGAKNISKRAAVNLPMVSGRALRASQMQATTFGGGR